jgi:tRNA(fMet)-specific endonuclease VapC
MAIICLDTNVLIAHKRAKTVDKDKTFLYRLVTQSHQLAVSTITVYELLRGDNQDEDQYWQVMFNNMKILVFDYTCAGEAAKIYETLKKAGKLIEAEDIFIAATALRYQMPLATGNIKHFERVEGLALIKEF